MAKQLWSMEYQANTKSPPLRIAPGLPRKVLAQYKTPIQPIAASIASAQTFTTTKSMALIEVVAILRTNW